MPLKSRVERLEKYASSLRSRRKITAIVETVVEPSPNGAVPVQIRREFLADNGFPLLEIWGAPNLPDRLPDHIDLAALERAKADKNS
jgi:hypothetical protein